jgi:O-acetyl-ADP-ribose deacetylase
LLATHHNIDSIAFPNISTGLFGYPKELAAETAIPAVKQHQSSGRKLKEVIFCRFDEENFRLYDGLL